MKNSNALFHVHSAPADLAINSASYWCKCYQWYVMVILPYSAMDCLSFILIQVTVVTILPGLSQANNQGIYYL